MFADRLLCVHKCLSVRMYVCVIECDGICIDTVYSGPHGQCRHVSISALCVFADCFRSYIKPTCAWLLRLFSMPRNHWTILYKNTLVSFNIQRFKLRIPDSRSKTSSCWIIYQIDAYLASFSNLSTIHKKITINLTRRHTFVSSPHLLIIQLIPLCCSFSQAVLPSSDFHTHTPVIMEHILKLVETEHTERDNNAPPSLTGCLTGAVSEASV